MHFVFRVFACLFCFVLTFWKIKRTTNLVWRHLVPSQDKLLILEGTGVVEFKPILKIFRAVTVTEVRHIPDKNSNFGSLAIENC